MLSSLSLGGGSQGEGQRAVGVGMQMTGQTSWRKKRCMVFLCGERQKTGSVGLGRPWGMGEEREPGASAACSALVGARKWL